MCQNCQILMLRDTTPTLTPSHATCGLLGIVKLPSAASLQNAILLDLRHFKSPGQCKSIKCYKCDRCWHVSQNQMQLKSHFIPINASRDFNKPSSALRRLISVSGLLSIVNQFNVTRVGIYSPKLQPHPHYCSARPTLRLSVSGNCTLRSARHRRN